METWLEILRGPVFRLALVVAGLGLLRELGLAVWGAAEAYYRANDKNLPWKQMALTTLGWLVPVKNLWVRARRGHGFLSFIMHLGLLLAPLLLLDHLLLWEQGLGLRGFRLAHNLVLPALPKGLADALTLITLATAVGLIISRVASPISRTLSRFQDYFILILIILIFTSGFMASRAWNPLPYSASMIIHVAAGDTLLILSPFTKLAHMLVYPVVRFAGELGWKFPSRAGEEVALTLDGKEVRPI